MNKIIIYLFAIALIITISSQNIVIAQETPENTIETAVTNPSVGAVSCPVPNGQILTHSHQVGTTLPVGGGHCTPGFYGLACGQCGTQGRRAKAIDVATNGGDVYLPSINGASVNWTLLTMFTIAPIDGGGQGMTFETTSGSDKWYIDFVHMAGSPNLEIRGVYPSGTSIGKVVSAHVHFTLGKNLNQPPAAGSATDCDPGWMPSDFACDPNAPPPVTLGAPSITSSQKATTSNRLCVKVGTPSTEKPAACTTPTTTGGALPIDTQTAPTVEAEKLADTINEQFGVSFQGAWDEKHLRWVYEKFFELKQTTKFIGYINRQPVILIGGIPNQETGVVQMSQTGDYANDKDYFLGTLIHEFGHVIYHKPLPENLAGEVNNLYSRINCVSSYSRCQTDKTENYPEVMAYCLNPKVVGTIRPEIWAQYRDIAVRAMGFCYN